MLTGRKILQIEPWIDDDERRALNEVAISTYLTEKDMTEHFEKMLREYTGARHAIAVANGSLALFAGLKALNIGFEDEVIVPNLTFVASANAVIMAGATPIFCDIEPNHLCIDVDKAIPLITKRTKAIMPVHLYGQCGNIDSLMKTAETYDVKVIEDAAQSIGVKYRNQHVGFQGDLGIISFYGNKTITCGEGGVVLTARDDLARKVRYLKNHGREKRGTFIHEHIGYNLSITEMQSAIGICQMNKLPKIIERKKEIYETYCKGLNHIEKLREIKINADCEPVYWFTSFLTKERDALAEYLANNGIQTRRFFCPLHLQPCYSHMKVDRTCFPVSERIYSDGISLPSSVGLLPEDQEYIITKIQQFFGY